MFVLHEIIYFCNQHIYVHILHWSIGSACFVVFNHCVFFLGNSESSNLEPITTSPRVLTLTNNSLLILSTEFADEGWYICTARNEGTYFL